MLKTIERKPSSIKMEQVKITPSIAEAWLDKNVSNRKASRQAVGKYARDMQSGAWLCTGDPIKFNAAGDLIDGQHRLMACIKAGVGFDSFVIYGLPDNAKSVVDTGKSRSARDVLAMGGALNAVRLASAARALLDYRSESIHRNQTWSHSEILDVIERHPTLPKSVGLFGKVSRGAPVAYLNFVHCVATSILGKENEATKMYQVWQSGVPAYDGDPMHLLRERVLSGQVGHRQLLLPTLCHAWNMFSAGQPVKNLRMRTDFVSIGGLNTSAL